MELHNQHNVLSVIRFVGQEPIITNAIPTRLRTRPMPQIATIDYDTHGHELSVLNWRFDQGIRPLHREELEKVGFARHDRTVPNTQGNYAYLSDGTFFLTDCCVSHVLLPTLIDMSIRSVRGAGQYQIKPSRLSLFGQAMSLGENNQFLYPCRDYSDFNTIAQHFQLNVTLQEPD